MAQVPPPYLPDPTPPRKKAPVVLIVLLVVGAVIVFPCIILAAILFPVFSQAKIAAQKSTSLSNLKQQALGALIYAADNNERLPLAQNWQTGLDPYVGESRGVSIFAFPGELGDWGYAYYRPSSGLDTRTVEQPGRMPLTFEAKASGASPSGTVAEFPTEAPRPGPKPEFGLSFVDGSARMVELGWKPPAGVPTK